MSIRNRHTSICIYKFHYKHDIMDCIMLNQTISSWKMNEWYAERINSYQGEFVNKQWFDITIIALKARIFT